MSHSLGWCLECRNSHNTSAEWLVDSTVRLGQWPAQAASKEVARNPTLDNCGLGCLWGKFLLSAMQFMFDSCPKNQENLPVSPIIIFLPCQFMHSGCFPLVHLLVPLSGALHRVAQVNRALYRGPCTLHSHTRGAVVAVSLMAHRHRNLSRSQRSLCRS